MRSQFICDLHCSIQDGIRCFRRNPPGRLSSPDETDDSRNKKQHNRDPEEDASAFHCRSGDAAKSKKSRDQRDHEKRNGVIKQIAHGVLLTAIDPVRLLTPHGPPSSPIEQSQILPAKMNRQPDADLEAGSAAKTGERQPRLPRLGRQLVRLRLGFT
jgi:hypothetical protein